MANPSIITRNTKELAEKSGNLYLSLFVIGERAARVCTDTKEELTSKLAEFASTVDNLEEILKTENKLRSLSIMKECLNQL